MGIRLDYTPTHMGVWWRCGLVAGYLDPDIKYADNEHPAWGPRRT
jgi:hypothetical protein